MTAGRAAGSADLLAGVVTPGVAPEVAVVLEVLVRAGQSLAVAESLTGGLLTATLTSVPGSSAVVRGGVVAYATDLKARLLGVDPVLLAETGPVDVRVAEAMAAGAREHLAATFGVATTGEAGPDSASGAPVGTVHVAVCGPDGTRSLSLHLAGDREQVRAEAVSSAIRVLAEALGAG
jgi:nicotinamide-nucleotide amidase